MGRRRRAAGVLVSLAAALPLAAGCGSSTGAAATGPTAAGFAFGRCDSVGDAEVAEQAHDRTLTRTITSPYGCQWESPSRTVRTWWYRDSPLADARTRAGADRATVADLTVAGLPALTDRNHAGRCDVDVVAGPDVVVWSVDGTTPGVDACTAATALAGISAARGRRSGADTTTFATPDEAYPCGLADESTVAGQVGAAGGVKVFEGDVCQWSLAVPGGRADALSSWFVQDTLDREKTLTAALGYAATPLRIDRDQAVTLRDPKVPGDCGVEVQTDSGTVGWWIAYRAPADRSDPCGVAATLAKSTLDLEP
ncbi:DUF3558 domain-containing protein [Rhodococcus sp. D2-41]|uniref:DUF3558 domain-containing protein n=1 Tax=Speluncibacter jeojiensis TaxID=2710754 RepID=A0A9X4M2Q9_9ACTN|nr:DUF3558 family protein [Rhodococcus sp. D2-41]MDG3010396.1 DUF3558 domain-containing protein [Rhodococcus sp. D2-41]MDG3014133.1 DUF3558 domain-containing protein [Corynebacteriales bacterium D3-21]